MPLIKTQYAAFSARGYQISSPRAGSEGTRAWMDLERFELVSAGIKVACSSEAQQRYALARLWMVISQHTSCARPKNGG
jgi:hypothetical protein